MNEGKKSLSGLSLLEVKMRKVRNLIDPFL